MERTVTGRIKHIEIDGAKYPTAGLDVQPGRRVGRSALLGADYGSIERRVLAHTCGFEMVEPRGMTLTEWFEQLNPVNVCGTCGCAHRSPYDDCNACRAGMRAARQQLTAERLRRAFKTFEGACAAAGIAFTGAMEAMGCLSDHIVILPAESDASLFHARFMDPVRVDVGGVDMPWKSERLAIFPSCPGGEVTDGAEILRALRSVPPVPVLPSFDFFASGLMHQAFGRATRPEPRPKRDRRNRGPEQHGKWWQKGRRW